MNLKILILGKGFIGNELAKALSGNFNVKILSKKDFDYTSYPLLLKLLRQEHFFLVINASGYTGNPNVDACEYNKEICWKLNVDLPITIARACEASNNTHFIHISSGCIYNGYDNVFSEDDNPNFGLFDQESSFYSKSKHAAELALKQFPCWMFRIRMPFLGLSSPRNILNKLLKYNALISMSNSMTSIDDFAAFTLKFAQKLSQNHIPLGILNVVNPTPLDAKYIMAQLNDAGLSNPNHTFIPLSQLSTKANRSNCVLSTNKIERLELGLPDSKLSLNLAINSFIKNYKINTA